MANAYTPQILPETRAAYGLSSHAVVAAYFGVRFGTLSLARPFVLDLSRIPEGPDLLAILYAGHAAEEALFGPHHTHLIAPRSLHFLELRETLAEHGVVIDADAVRRVRWRARALVQEPGRWAAIGALAERLEAGETLGSLTARRLILSYIING